MIRVLHVISDTNIGGAGMQMLGLLSGLDRGVFDTKVVLPRSSMLRNPVDELGIGFLEIDNLAEKSFSRRSILPLYRLIKSFGPDIVHAHAALSARVAARMWGKCKIVNTRHSVFPPTGKQKRLRHLTGALENFLGDVVIAVSDGAKKNLLQLGVKERKIKVVNNGIDPAMFKFDKEQRIAARAELSIRDDVFCVGHVGRFGPEKNHAFLLEVFSEVCRQRNSVLILVGTGELFESTRAKAEKMGIGEKTHFLGGRSDTAKLYQAFDVFLMPSKSEGFGLVAVEAQCSGLPCVLSSHIPQAVKCSDAVRFIPIDNASEWAKACMGLESPDRENAHLNVEKSGLDAKTMCDETARIYLSLVRR